MSFCEEFCDCTCDCHEVNADLDKLSPEGLSISIDTVYRPCFVYLEAHIAWGLFVLSLLHQVLRYATLVVVLVLGWTSALCLFFPLFAFLCLLICKLHMCTVFKICKVMRVECSKCFKSKPTSQSGIV